MAKNERKINNGKDLLDSGKLKTFTQLEALLTINFIRKALGRSDHRTVKTKIFDPRKFTVGNFLDLAKELGADPTQLWLLALKQLGIEVKECETKPLEEKDLDVKPADEP